MKSRDQTAVELHGTEEEAVKVQRGEATGPRSHGT